MIELGRDWGGIGTKTTLIGGGRTRYLSTTHRILSSHALNELIRLGLAVITPTLSLIDS